MNNNTSPTRFRDLKIGDGFEFIAMPLLVYFKQASNRYGRVGGWVRNIKRLDVPVRKV